MATKTIGTLSTTTGTGVQYFPNIADADLATLNQLLWRDAGSVIGPLGSGGINSDGGGNKPGQIQPGGFTKQGLFYMPGGRTDTPIQAQPGDWFVVDGFGNGFIVPQRACPKTLTQSVTLTSGSNKITSTVDIRTLGWQVGTHVTSVHTPANAVISEIDPGGLGFQVATVTVSPFAVNPANATGSATETMTAGTWTHS